MRQTEMARRYMLRWAVLALVLALARAQSCVQGHFIDSGNSGVCTLCPLGKYQNAVDQNHCMECIVGKVAHTTGSTECAPCGTGHHQDQTGQGTCKHCPAGQFGGATGQTTCQNCAGGQQQPSAGQNGCDQCATGKYNQALSPGDMCESCLTGMYADVVGSTLCKTCPPGQNQVSSGKTSCTACESGRYINEAGLGTACLSCPLGRYQHQTGQTACINCPMSQNTISMASTDSSACVDCVAGRYGDVAGLPCKTCPVGMHQDLPGQNHCNTCPVGKYAVSSQATCPECVKGKYQSQTGQASCVDCPMSQETPGVGSTESSACVACATGHFGDAVGTACKICPAGKHQDLTGQSTCTECAIDKYNDSPGGFVCHSCPAGQAQENTGQTQCYCDVPAVTSCPTSWQECQSCSSCYQAGSSVTGCDDSANDPCTASRVVSGGGGVPLYVCEHASSTLSISSCSLYAAGDLFNAVTINTGLYCCEPGTFGPSCTDCPAGKYQDQAVQSDCKVCPAGTEQLSSGQTTCDCPSPVDHGYCNDIADANYLCASCESCYQMDNSAGVGCSDDTLPFCDAILRKQSPEAGQNYCYRSDNITAGTNGDALKDTCEYVNRDDFSAHTMSGSCDPPAVSADPVCDNVPRGSFCPPAPYITVTSGNCTDHADYYPITDETTCENAVVHDDFGKLLLTVPGATPADPLFNSIAPGHTHAYCYDYLPNK